MITSTNNIAKDQLPLQVACDTMNSSSTLVFEETSKAEAAIHEDDSGVGSVEKKVICFVYKRYMVSLRIIC